MAAIREALAHGVKGTAGNLGYQPLRMAAADAMEAALVALVAAATSLPAGRRKLATQCATVPTLLQTHDLDALDAFFEFTALLPAALRPQGDAVRRRIEDLDFGEAHRRLRDMAGRIGCLPPAGAEVTA